MRTTKELKWLECTMNQQEIIEEGRILSNSLIAARELEDSLNSVKARIKGELAEHEKKINVCTQRITSGKMQKEVECYTEFDTDKEKVITVRTDTYEVIFERMMAPSERQTELELEAEKNEETAADNVPKPGDADFAENQTPS